MARIVTPAYFIGGQEIATNDLAVTSESPVSIKSGFVDLAVAGDKVEGVSVETKTFEADNQTVKWAKLEFVRLGDDTLVEFTVTNGVIAQANVGTLYDLSATGTVDGATAWLGDSLTLRKVISSTLGQFVWAK